MPDPSRDRSPTDQEFARFWRTRDPQALAAVFDATAPSLLLVAMHLVGDAADAEDLVQTVFLQAIRDVDRYDPAQAVLPWLLGILRHRALDLRDRVHRRRETGEAPPAVASGEARPDQAAAGAETLELVGRALDGLPREYREVLTLRLVHGLRAVDIAHAQSASPETVRTRLRRGLQMLRKVLPRGLATPALIALLGQESLRAGTGLAAIREQVLRAVPATAVAAGGLAVGKWAAAAALVAITLAWPLLRGFHALTGTPPAGPPAAPIAMDVRPEGTATAPGNAAEVDPSPVQRTAVPPPAPASTTVLHGRAVAAETGAPLAGVAVTFTSEWARERGDAPASWSPPPDVTTGADGAFRFAFEPPPTLMFNLRFEGGRRLARFWSRRSLRTGIVVDLGDVPMVAGTPVQIVVGDEQGQPRPGLQVVLRDPRVFDPQPGPTSHAPLPQPLTDEAGVAAWPAVPCGPLLYTIYKVPAGDLHGTLDVPAQIAPFVHHVVLRRPPPELSVSGTVVDTLGGPVAGLELMIPAPSGGGGYWPAETGPDGTFLRSLARPLEGGHRFRMRLHERHGDLELVEDGGEFTWGRNDLRLVVRRRQPANLTITVVDGNSGAPVEHFGAVCHRYPWRSYLGMRPLQAEPLSTHPGGITRFTDLMAGAHRVSVFPPAPYAERGEVPVEVGEGQDATLRVVVDWPAPLSIQVVQTGNQEPLAGAVVSLAKVVPESEAIRVTTATFRLRLDHARRGGGWSTGANVLVIDQAATDERGHVTLHAAPEQPALVVLVEGDPCVARIVHGVSLPRGGGTLRIEVDAAARVTGVVRPAEFLARFGPDARGLARAAIELPDSDTRDGRPGVELRAPGTPRRVAATPIAADGTFRMSALPPGRYEVWLTVTVAYSGGSTTEDLGPFATAELPAGANTTVEVDAGPFMPGRVSARFFVDGQPVRGEVGFACIDPAGRSGPSLQRTGTGAARSEWLLPGRYAPCVADRDGHLTRYLFGAETFVVAPGAEVEITASIRRRRVTLVLQDTDGRPVADRRLVVEPLDLPELAWPWRHGERTDAQGVAVIDPAPPGRLRVRAFAADQNVHRVVEDPPRVVVGEIPGGAEEATLRLAR